MAFLIGIHDKITGQRFVLNKERTTIGRDGANDIVLDDNTVSAFHSCILCRDNRFEVHDLNSTNGTRVNGKGVKDTELEPKNLIQFGSVEFMFDLEPTDQTTPSPSRTHTQVIFDASMPVAAPKSFSSVSPFGARYTEKQGLWLVVIIVISILALFGLIFFLYQTYK